MYLTPHSREQLGEFARGNAMSLSDSWWVGLAYALDSNGIPEEVNDSTYARVPIERSLTAWSGTQGPASVLASYGTSHESSNNVVIDFGSQHGNWGTPLYAVLYDDEFNGNAWFAIPIAALEIASGAPASFQPGVLRFVFGIVSGTSDYLSNKMVDLLMRAQPYSWPATVHVGYSTTLATNATPGTEPSIGTGYAREPVDADATGWDLTDGELSNVDPVVFNPATLDQGDIVGQQLFDAASGGNMLFHGELDDAPISIRAGEDPPQFPAGALRYFFA